MEIPTKEDYKEVEPINHNINCHTAGSKFDDNWTGAGVLINYSHDEIAEEAIHLSSNETVFQAEVFQREEQHPTLYSLKSKKCFLNRLRHDTRAAIMALDNNKIKSKATRDAVLAINKLRENQVLIRWIPAHSGYVGKEGTLAKKRSQ